MNPRGLQYIHGFYSVNPRGLQYIHGFYNVNPRGLQCIHGFYSEFTDSMQRSYTWRTADYVDVLSVAAPPKRAATYTVKFSDMSVISTGSVNPWMATYALTP